MFTHFSNSLKEMFKLIVWTFKRTLFHILAEWQKVIVSFCNCKCTKVLKRTWSNDTKSCKSKAFVCKSKNYFVPLVINFHGFRKIHILKEIKKFLFFGFCKRSISKSMKIYPQQISVTSVLHCSASNNQNWKSLLSDTFISVVSRTLLSLKCNVGPSGRWVMTNPSHTGLRKRCKLLLHSKFNIGV